MFTLFTLLHLFTLQGKDELYVSWLLDIFLVELLLWNLLPILDFDDLNILGLNIVIYSLEIDSVIRFSTAYTTVSWVVQNSCQSLPWLLNFGGCHTALILNWCLVMHISWKMAKRKRNLILSPPWVYSTQEKQGNASAIPRFLLVYIFKIVDWF